MAKYDITNCPSKEIFVRDYINKNLPSVRNHFRYRFKAKVYSRNIMVKLKQNDTDKSLRINFYPSPCEEEIPHRAEIVYLTLNEELMNNQLSLGCWALLELVLNALRIVYMMTYIHRPNEVILRVPRRTGLDDYIMGNLFKNVEVTEEDYVLTLLDDHSPLLHTFKEKNDYLKLISGCQGLSRRSTNYILADKIPYVA